MFKTFHANLLTERPDNEMMFHNLATSSRNTDFVSLIDSIRYEQTDIRQFAVVVLEDCVWFSRKAVSPSQCKVARQSFCVRERSLKPKLRLSRQSSDYCTVLQLRFCITHTLSRSCESTVSK